MPLSSRPQAKARQLANLKRGGVPPAPADNQRAKVHGGYARVAVERLEAKVREVFHALAEDAPLRAPNGGLPAHDAVAVRLAAEALCRLDDVSANVRDFGLLDAETGNPRPAVDLERRLRLEALDYLRELGMTPAARARLGLDLVRQHDLALDMQADYEREQREAEGA